MIQHDNILIVPVPDDASGFRIHIDDETWLFFWTASGWEGIDSMKLPPGDWRILGRSKELTEEQWREVVKADGSGWFDYERDNPPCIYPFTSATESGMSLLRLHGIDPETNPLILKKGG